jgi:hypothetical protein
MTSGIGRPRGAVLPENERMLKLLRSLDVPKRTYLKNGLVYVEMDLESEKRKGRTDAPGRSAHLS